MNKEKLNIALITFEFPPHNAIGGIGSYFFNLANLLGNYGHKVFVFSCTNKKPTHVCIKNENYENYLILASSNNQFRKEVTKVFSDFLLENKIDVIESPEVGACALDIKNKYPLIPLIVKMHTPGVLITKIYNSHHTFFKKMRYVLGSLRKGKLDLGFWATSDKNMENDDEYIICTKADVLLSPSNALKKWAINFWKFEENKINVIANPYFIYSEQQSNVIDRDNKIICFVGKLTILKGIVVLTEAIKKIVKQYPEYRFKIVGRDEPISKEIQSAKSLMINTLGKFSKKVDFLGVLNGEEVRNVFETSDICLVPSLWENCPTVILEAMAAGCPVIAADRGGMPELIEHKKTGLLFSATSSNDLAKKIKLLIEHKNFGFELAKNAQVSMLNNINLQKNILNIYEQFQKHDSNN